VFFLNTVYNTHPPISVLSWLVYLPKMAMSIEHITLHNKCGVASR